MKHGRRRHHRRARGISDVLTLAKNVAPHALQIGKSGKAIYDAVKSSGNPFKKAKAPDVTTAEASGRRRRKSYRRKRGRGIAEYRKNRTIQNDKAVKRLTGSGAAAPYHAGGLLFGRTRKNR